VGVSTPRAAGGRRLCSLAAGLPVPLGPWEASDTRVVTCDGRAKDKTVTRKSPRICTTLAMCEMARSCLITTVCQVHKHGISHGMSSRSESVDYVLCVLTNRTRQLSILEHPGFKFPMSSKAVSIDSDLCRRLPRFLTGSCTACKPSLACCAAKAVEHASRLTKDIIDVEDTSLPSAAPFYWIPANGILSQRFE
jgi:hypothetical protein